MQRKNQQTTKKKQIIQKQLKKKFIILGDQHWIVQINMVYQKIKMLEYKALKKHRKTYAGLC